MLESVHQESPHSAQRGVGQGEEQRAVCILARSE